MRVTSYSSVTTILPLYVVVLGAPAVIGTVDRSAPAPPYLHGVPRRVHEGDLGAADGEVGVLCWMPNDPRRALDVAQPQIDGDLGARLPVLPRPEVRRRSPNQCAGHLNRRVRGDPDGAFDGRAVARSSG